MENKKVNKLIEGTILPKSLPEYSITLSAEPPFETVSFFQKGFKRFNFSHNPPHFLLSTKVRPFDTALVSRPDKILIPACLIYLAGG